MLDRDYNTYLDRVGTVEAVAALPTVLAVGKTFAVELEALAVLAVALHSLMSCRIASQTTCRSTQGPSTASLRSSLPVPY